MVASTEGDPERTSLIPRTKRLSSAVFRAQSLGALGEERQWPQAADLPEENWVSREARSPDQSCLASCRSPDGSAGATTWKRGTQGGTSQVSSCCTRKRLRPTHNPRPPCRKPAMLTEGMQLWHGLVIAFVSLVLQACLLAAIYYLLSRHMAKENEQLLRRSRLWAPRPSPAHHCSPAAQETKETKENGAERSTPGRESRYRNNCHTSSESSDTSDSAGHSPPTCQATRNVNYTQVVFPATGRLENTSALDYEDIEDVTDYVNVDPKSHKHNFWTFVNPAASEPVEYSQVAM